MRRPPGLTAKGTDVEIGTPAREEVHHIVPPLITLSASVFILGLMDCNGGKIIQTKELL